MNDPVAVARSVAQVLEACGLRYLVGGSLASSLSGEPRSTEPGAPEVLFPTRIVDGGVDTQGGRQYDVAPDGRFLINTELPGDAAPITLIQHWNPGSKN